MPGNHASLPHRKFLKVKLFSCKIPTTHPHEEYPLDSSILAENPLGKFLVCIFKFYWKSPFLKIFSQKCHHPRVLFYVKIKVIPLHFL
jgi:hypothetical protein